MPAEPALPPADRAVVRGPRKRRPFLQRQYLSLWKRILSLAPQLVAFLRRWEKTFGPAGLPVILVPAIGFDLLRRAIDYREFKKARRALPPAFWRGLTPARHYLLMIRNWQCTLAAGLLGDRLDSPAWRRRIRVRGTPPEKLPGWGERPVILVHLHTGAYGVIHYWLRAQRLKATSYRAGLPQFLTTPWANRIFDAADRVQGLTDIPSMFVGPRSLRRMIDFLIPGHVLVVALDAESVSSARFSVRGHEIRLSQGVAHLAHAIVVPISMSCRGLARFDIRFGPPVPDDLIDRRNPGPTIQHLLDWLWHEVEKDPSVLGWNSLLCVGRPANPNHISWP
jgi:hypothetical protein